jgi:hypothetical protein
VLVIWGRVLTSDPGLLVVFMLRVASEFCLIESNCLVEPSLLPPTDAFLNLGEMSCRDNELEGLAEKGTRAVQLSVTSGCIANPPCSNVGWVYG